MREVQTAEHVKDETWTLCLGKERMRWGRRRKMMMEEWISSNIFVSTAGHLHMKKYLMKFDDLNTIGALSRSEN